MNSGPQLLRRVIEPHDSYPAVALIPQRGQDYGFLLIVPFFIPCLLEFFSIIVSRPLSFWRASDRRSACTSGSSDHGGHIDIDADAKLTPSAFARVCSKLLDGS